MPEPHRSSIQFSVEIPKFLRCCSDFTGDRAERRHYSCHRVSNQTSRHREALCGTGSIVTCLVVTNTASGANSAASSCAAPTAESGRLDGRSTRRLTCTRPPRQHLRLRHRPRIRACCRSIAPSLAKLTLRSRPDHNTGRGRSAHLQRRSETTSRQRKRSGHRRRAPEISLRTQHRQASGRASLPAGRAGAVTWPPSSSAKDIALPRSRAASSSG